MQYRSSLRLSLLWACFVFCVTTGIALKQENAVIFVVGLVAVTLLLASYWWQRPHYLLLAFVIYLVLQDGVLAFFHQGVTLARILPDIGLFAAFLGQQIFAYRQQRHKWQAIIVVPLFFLLGVMVISAVVNHIPITQAIQGPYTMLRYVTVFFLIAASELTEGELLVFLRILAWLVIAEGLLSFAQFGLIHTPLVTHFTSAKAQGTLAHYNILGTFLALALLIVLATFVFSPLKSHWWELSAIFACGICALALTLSRQSILGLCVGGIVLAWLSRQSWTWVRLRQFALLFTVPIILSIVTLFLWFSFPLPCTAFIRPGSTTSRPPTSSAAMSCQAHRSTLDTILIEKSPQRIFDVSFFHNARLYTIVNAGPAIWSISPFLGLGPGTFGSQPTFMDAAFYERLHVGLLFSNPDATLVADDEWMNVFGQLGLLGVLGFLWLFGEIGVTGYRIWKQSSRVLTRRLGAVCVAFVPCFCVIAWFGPNFEERPISILLWFILGCAVARSLREKETVPSTV